MSVYYSIDDITQQTTEKKDDMIYNKKARLTEIKSCSDFCKWIMTNPTSKLPFFVSILISFALSIYYFMDNDASFIIYLIAGISGLMINIYGLNHFRSLLNLKHEIDHFHKLSKQFAKENKLLDIEVDTLLAANNNLKDTHSKLLNANIKQKENLQQFRNIEENLKIANLDSIEGITNIREKAKIIQTNLKQHLLTKERTVLYRVFSRFEESDKSEGMTRDKFDEFSKNVPRAYQERFNRLGTFRKLAAGKSYIHFNDFKICLDIFAQMSVEDVDIDFKIEYQVSSEDIMPRLERTQVSITKKSKQGVKFTTDDIQYND